MIDRECQKLDDKQLVALSLEDSQYFYCLMKRYEDKLSAYVHRFLFLSPDDVDDIVENSFIKAYEHLNDCDCDLKFSTWLYRIVHNEAINFFKKSRASFQVSLPEDNENFVNWLVADTDIEKETIALHQGQEIKKILNQLKPEYKDVLVLKFFEDKDYQEISDILQKPMGTVATLISRAKIQFKKIYEKK
ncbi:MAG TPA: sigma-70 family RNA polymerase sigma factor [Candidatus Woesebacteria bacterium]|nr:sigma-70 family RNA polymerase sigma factor [Candidatus Woesebacteria bacterium]HPR99398.1 sigma-70 family RNA polymerase sigma factor [Candidatus Woesebacteria bacterium]